LKKDVMMLEKKYLDAANTTKSIKSEIIKAQQNAWNLNIFIYDKSKIKIMIDNSSLLTENIEIYVQNSLTQIYSIII